MVSATKKLVVAASAALASLASADSVAHLTQANFEKEAMKSGKGALIKFFAPWCGHCKALRPAWDKLADDFKNDPSVLIADVDCTVEDSVCQRFDVRGYPTLKYYNAESGVTLQDYQGGRDGDSLTKFVKEKLASQCSVKEQKECSDKEKTFIAKWQPKTKTDQDKEWNRLKKLALGNMTTEKKAWVIKRNSLLGEMLGKSMVDVEHDDLDDDDEL
ncbi:unnamed protein product [Amoebophrya sp. A120]|nr:unnamed protein product [Amoebophrya sp. A120]|eukprot:GSA120T00007602001.1